MTELFVSFHRDSPESMGIDIPVFLNLDYIADRKKSTFFFFTSESKNS
jgi:hypothetical protein